MTFLNQIFINLNLILSCNIFTSPDLVSMLGVSLNPINMEKSLSHTYCRDACQYPQVTSNSKT